MKTLLVLGAGSDIGAATALEFAKDGWNLILCGRDLKNLERIARDISLRSGADCQIRGFDAGVDSAEEFWNSLPVAPDGVFCAIGSLGDQMEARTNSLLAEKILNDNFTGLVPVLSKAANVMEEKKAGLIIGVSSVAGDRGRASNYTYGAAKAGFSAYLEGMRQRLAKSGVHVLTVKPGFVATKMTDGLDLPKLLTATPEEAGRAILKAAKKKKDTIYVKGAWRPIMFVIRSLPGAIFNRLNF